MTPAFEHGRRQSEDHVARPTGIATTVTGRLFGTDPVEIAYGLVSIPIMGRSARDVSLMPEAWKLRGSISVTRRRRLTAWGTEHGGFAVQRILAKEGQDRLPGDDDLRRIVLKLVSGISEPTRSGFPFLSVGP